MTPLGDVLEICPDCGSHHTYIDHGFDEIVVQDPLIVMSTEIWRCTKCDHSWTSSVQYVAGDPGYEEKSPASPDLEMWDQEMVEYLSRFAQ